MVVTIESCEAFCIVIGTTIFHGHDYDLKRLLITMTQWKGISELK